MSNANGAKWIRPEKRVRIYARDSWRCQWCKRSAAGGAQLTLDHFLSRDAGGSNEAGNLVTACFDCNSERRHAPALTFAAKTPRFGGTAAVLDRVLDALERPLPAFIP
jgi:5-methylcytosine-specific restriction endonuclease McrA